MGNGLEGVAQKIGISVMLFLFLLSLQIQFQAFLTSLISQQSPTFPSFRNAGQSVEPRATNKTG